MRNTILFIIIITFIPFINPALSFALSPTPAPNSLEQQISNLKDKIASRVAQLKLVDKRGIIGNVTDVTQNQITVSDVKGNTRYIDVDELTKFSSPSAKSSFGISDITKGAKIGVLGLYNKESRRILARFVDVIITPTFFSGAISDIDKTNFSFTFVTVDKNSFSVEVQDVTKTLSYDPTGGLLRAGFSKITLAERVSVIGFTDIKNSHKIIPTRILLFPTIPVNPAITIIKPQGLDLQGTIVPSTGSGRKLTPLTK